MEGGAEEEADLGGRAASAGLEGVPLEEPFAPHIWTGQGLLVIPSDIRPSELMPMRVIVCPEGGVLGGAIGGCYWLRPTTRPFPLPFTRCSGTFSTQGTNPIVSKIRE